jgi:PEP-CTERM motif
MTPSRKKFRSHCTALALLLATLTPLRAELYDLQPAVSPADSLMPTGHSFIISTWRIGNRFILWTLDEAYESPIAGSVRPDGTVQAVVWTKIATLRNLVRPRDTSLVRGDPRNPNLWYVSTFNADDTPIIYTVQQSPPAVLATTPINSAFDDIPRDFAINSAGTFFLLDSNNHLIRMGDARDTPTVLATTSPSTFSLEVSGDVVFTLDATGTVSRYSTNGDFLSQYTLANITMPREFAVNERGLLFAMDGIGSSDYGGIYNATNGEYLGSFYLAASDLIDPKSSGGKVTMFANDQTLVAQTGTGAYYWSYDISGIPAPVPEPSTCAMLGLGICGLIAFRRSVRR